MARLVSNFCMAAVAVSLAACSDPTPSEAQRERAKNEDNGLNLSRLIGISKNPPDEFAVISAAPLEVPKDFAALPEPRLGAQSPRMPNALSDARVALLGEKAAAAQPANVRTSASESALLSSLGPADPQIRTVLDQEQAQYDSKQDRYVLDRLIPSLKKLRQDELDANLVVPTEERARLASDTVRQTADARGIATIPSASVPSVTAPAAPSVDPATGEALIYIPE